MAERKLIVQIVGDDDSLRKAFLRSSKGAAHFNRDIGRATRGALAGSGAFHSLGRSIAFASGTFVGVASLSTFLRASVDAAKEAAVTQKQLAAQFRASGKDVRDYQEAIDKTANRLSLLAGIQNDEIKAGFTTIFRTTNDVSKALRDTATAADLARAKNLSFAQASLIIAKTEAGNTTLLRRQGFQIAKNAKAEDALAKLRRIVAGQARAGTTAQERFSATLHDSEEIIGGALLPVLNKYLTRASVWLTNMNESGQLQKDVNAAVRTAGEVFRGLESVVGPLATGFKTLGNAVGGTKNEVKLLATAFLFLRTRSLLISLGLIRTGVTGIGTSATVATAEVGALRTSLLTLGGGTVLAALAGLSLALSEAFVPRQGPKIKGFKNISGGTGSGGSAYVGPNGNLWIRTPDGRTTDTGVKATARNSGGLVGATRALTTPVRGLDTPSRFAPTPTTSVRATGRPLSLAGQFNIAELRLAQAQVRGSTSDEVKQLRVEAAIVRLQLARTKTLKDRIAKTQQLGGILQEIASLTVSTETKSAAAVKKHADEWVKLGGKIQAIPHDMRSVLDAAKKTAVGSETAFQKADLSKLVSGLGLSAQVRKALEARFSQVGAGGTVPRGSFAAPGGGGARTLENHTHIYIDGKEIAPTITRHQQKATRRNPGQRRGPHAGV